MSDFLKSLNISGSGLTAQKLRLDLISQNIANSETTRTESGGPYRRQVVVLKSTQETVDFKDVLEAAKRGEVINTHRLSNRDRINGVKVVQVVEDQKELLPVYNPTHPDANEDGYVMYPNVNRAQEIMDAMGASRAYEANVTAFNAMKQMYQIGLEMKL